MSLMELEHLIEMLTSSEFEGKHVRATPTVSLKPHHLNGGAGILQPISHYLGDGALTVHR
jgi:hypothetical protein